MDSISCVLIEGYSRIYGLNGFSLGSKKTLFKYMPLDRFIESIEKNELVFVSPSTWYDPFERMYFNADCSKHLYKTEEIACMCVTSQCTVNEEAAWRIYSDKGSLSVRVSMDIEKLFTFLDNYALENKCKVYIGNANYDFNIKEITNIKKTTSKEHNVFCPKKMKTEHYLSLMLLKRKSFAYENEIRIFIVKESNLFTNSTALLKIDYKYVDQRLYTKIMLSPYPKEDLQTQKGKIYKKLHEVEFNLLKKEIQALLGYNCSFQQSRLYDDLNTDGCVIEV